MTNLCGAHSDSSQLYIYQNYHHISILISLTSVYNSINYTGVTFANYTGKTSSAQSKALTTAQLFLKC